MIKIGLFLDSFYPMVDGVIETVNNYAKRLNDDNFSVAVFVPKPYKKDYVDNYPYSVFRCKSGKVSFLDYDLPQPENDSKFKKAIKDQNLDIIHVHSPFAVGKMAIRYGKKHHIPTIATFHSQFKKDFMRATGSSRLVTSILLKNAMWVFDNADLCLTMNEFSRDLLKSYGCKNPNIQLLQNGTDMQMTKNKQFYVDEANKRFGLLDEKFVLLYVGRINKLKNVDFIVESLALLPKDIKFKMLFVGEGQDLKLLQNKVKKLKLQNKVKFLGKIMDRSVLQCLYARSDLFLIPSTYDTDAIVKIEASCFETPSVCLYGTGAGSVIKDQENGFLVNEDCAEFANLIADLFHNPKKIQTAGIGARLSIYKTWDEVVGTLKGVYTYLNMQSNYKKLMALIAKKKIK